MSIIVNEDPNHFYLFTDEESDKRRIVEQYANTGVTDFFFSVNGQTSAVGSTILGTFWENFDNVDVENLEYKGSVKFDEYALLMKKLNHDGALYKEWINVCRENKISPWISIRMNDGHGLDETDDPNVYKTLAKFWKDHPEYRRVQNKPLSCMDNCFDFAHEEVRNRMLNYISELLSGFDVDGIELDWMRFGYHFKPGYEDEGREILNNFMRETRLIADNAEKRYGHKISIATRVPAKPENAYYLGYDAITWARENLIDILTITPFWFTADTDMPIEIWKQLLHGTKTKLAAGVEILLSSYPGAERYFNGYETTYGTAWSILNRGIDILYLFNYMNLDDDKMTPFINSEEEYRQLLLTLNNKDLLRETSKRHVATYCDTWAPGQPVAIHRPIELCKGLLTQTGIHIGEAPNKERDALVIIGVNEKLYTSFEEVLVNGYKCEKSNFKLNTDPIPAGVLYSFKIPNGALHSGRNLVETFGGKGKLIWMEIIVL